MRATTTKIMAHQGARGVARPQVKEPDPATAEGQLALYLAHLIATRSRVDKNREGDLAEFVGVQRSTVFNWLGGQGVGGMVKHFPAIAEYFKLASWQELIPSKEMVKKLIKARRATKL